MNKLLKLLIIITTSTTLGSCVTKSDLDKQADRFDNRLAVMQYLHECDWCDLAFKPGSAGHETCIIRATKKWMEIKKRRGWK